MRAGRILLALAAATAVAAPAHGAAGGLEPVGPGHAPAISADGRFVAFTSSEPLAPGDAHPGNDVFLRDMRLGTTTLVSRASGAQGAGGDDDSYEPSISADGRFVAFTSRAANLDADASAGIRYVFVRDVLEGVTTLVSRASGPAGAVAAFASDEPDISGDGRFVAFASGARNIVDDPAPAGVVVRDLQTHRNVIASRADGPAGASLRGRQPSISADGRFVAFVAGDALTGGVLLRDLRAGTTELVSVPPAAGVTTDLASYNPSVSDDGRRVAFESLANTLSDADADGTFAPDVFLRDLDARTTTLLSAGEISGHAVGPAISADGRRVAFSAFPFAPTGPDGTYVHDAAAGTTTLVSRAAGAEGTPARGILGYPAMSADGRYVAFTAYRTGLEPNGGRTYGVFRRDVLGPPPGEPEPVCAPVAAPPAAPSGESPRFTLTKRQLLINQRVAQAAIRRLNAVQARLDGRLAARDLCGHGIGAADLHPSIATEVAPAPLAPARVAAPEPIRPDPAAGGSPAAVRLTAAQLLINQRIGQAAVRRANAIEARLAEGLTGGDIADGAVGQGKLADRLRVTGATPVEAAPPSRTVIRPRATPPDPASVRLTVAQLRIDQRIFQAAVRRANALMARLEAGLAGDAIRDGSLTAADLAPGVAP